MPLPPPPSSEDPDEPLVGDSTAAADADTPAITLHLTDLACPDPLEKIFQQVEEQNELRAQQEAVEAADRVGRSIPRVESSENVKKGRRRGSISISRFGQLSSDATSDGSSAGPTTPALSDIAAKSPFFQQQLKHQNGSQTSFASGGSADDDAEDDHHVTHMHTIAPKQSLSRAMGGFLPRRLSRARSAAVVIPSNGGGENVVIGVSVAAATVELGPDAEVAGASVHAPGALHHQTSKGSMGGASLTNKSGWATRAAKNFTKKFRRKSKMPLAESSTAVV
ncbi:hypothetical protein R3P38DRAFT_3188350 [Favolaschia claudopus]|uniref:Uncharacterized protein n=1 Tax=Favolaschia claudopus TaxID=2862362 RepID=A0AAW0BV48_9AGAR